MPLDALFCILTIAAAPFLNIELPSRLSISSLLPVSAADIPGISPINLLRINIIKAALSSNIIFAVTSPESRFVRMGMGRPIISSPGSLPN